MAANKKSGSDNIYLFSESGSVKEFETDANGEVVITGLPFKDYTVREVSVPDGAKSQQSFITKSSMNISREINIGNAKIMTSIDGIPLELSRLIRTLDNGDIVLPTMFLTDSTSSFSYDNELGLYGYESEYIKRTESGYDAKIGLGNQETEKHMTYDNALGKYVALITYYDLFPAASGDNNELYAVFQGDVPILKFGADTLELVYDNDKKCFTASLDSSVFCMRKNANGYRLEAEDSRYNYRSGVELVYNEQVNKFIPNDYNLVYLILDEITDSTITFSLNPVLNYDEAFDRYYYVSGREVVMLYAASKIDVMDYAAEYLFVDESDRVPDTITNPQTSDLALKAIIIAGIGLALTFILRKQLTKRAN